ncbi:hypothetical protein XHV734_2919 [Xanthomonas hortorum pv. vitians]|nr:hypothetical protein XHV734_2919 [Xanthomonas hortorum pv. vitians]
MVEQRGWLWRLYFLLPSGEGAPQGRMRVRAKPRVLNYC